MKIGWSTWMYKKKVRRFDAVLRRRLCEMAASHVRYGYRRLTVLLRREGWTGFSIHPRQPLVVHALSASLQ
jgi:putative transposase